ncbi:sugar nucleotide-binding protein [Vibrio sinaloensis]|uniref:sugar nucleotide-binding protein n=1 Tax=Photobacterium sp. (strain ATCC 43367) TaxID=379097 RepID=UPI00205AA95D|nr:sugar nucleotide-binding protein [Vibrio sinaloensis]UPQ89546.1 sugar nucleotide-binding protein [Vibrio sinaloensis]
MKKVLMTGLSGSLGPKVAEQFTRRGWTVVEWNHHQISPDNQEQSETFWQEVDVDAVCHMAMGSEQWAQWLAQRSAWKSIPYLFVSTAMVFDAEQNGPYSIFSERNTKEEYGLYKMRSEDAIWAVNPSAMIARIGWQIHDVAVGNNMLAHLDQQQNEKGFITASTAWLPATSHMEDTAIGFLQLIERNEAGLYHLDSNAKQGWSFYQLVCALKQKYAKPWQVIPSNDYQHDQRLHDDRIALPPLSERFDEPRLIKTAGIVGLHWGRTHIPHYRASGVEVTTLCARTQTELEQVCEQEGVSNATTEMVDLNSMDVVTVATPAALHATAIDIISKPFIVCEKPLVGLEGATQSWQIPDKRILVNYAFSQLHTAKRIEQWLKTQRKPCRVNLNSRVNLSGDYSLKQWFVETVSHPVSWLLHCFGAVSQCQVEETVEQLVISLNIGEHSLTVNFCIGGPAGIEHDLEIHSDQRLQSKGYYRVGEKWRFEPTLVDGIAIDSGEYSKTDCWQDANKRSIALMMAMFNKSVDWEFGLSLGAFDCEKAIAIERLFEL